MGFAFCGTGLRADAADRPDENKIIVITTNTITPYSYFEGNKHVGFEVDLWEELAKRTDLEVHLETSVFSGLFGALESASCSLGSALVTTVTLMSSFEPAVALSNLSNVILCQFG